MAGREPGLAAFADTARQSRHAGANGMAADFPLRVPTLVLHGAPGSASGARRRVAQPPGDQGARLVILPGRALPPAAILPAVPTRLRALGRRAVVPGSTVGVLGDAWHR